MRYPRRVFAEPDVLSPQLQHDLASQKGDCMILAGKKENGDCAILISYMFSIDIEFNVEIPGLADYDVCVRVLDKSKDLDNAVYKQRGNVLEIRKSSYCAIYLIELFRKQ